MPNKKNKVTDRNALWVSRAEAINATSLTAGKFEQLIRRKISATDAKRIDGKLCFRLVALLAAFVEFKKSERTSALDADVEMLTGAETSPNLERFRGARADLEVMNADDRKRMLVNREVFGLLTIAAFQPLEKFVREAHAKYGAAHGKDAEVVLKESRDAITHAIENE